MTNKNGYKISELDDAFSKNLKKMRAFKGLFQRELAAMVNPSTIREYIADLERCKISPSLSTVDKIARALNVPPIMMLDRSGETNVVKLIAKYAGLEASTPGIGGAKTKDARKEKDVQEKKKRKK